MKTSILIVDDDFGHRSMLATLLSDWGYETAQAEDGEGGVELAREKPFDAVLMDVRMAGMGGIEAMKRIVDRNPSLPVLIMTAYSSVETAVEALKAGAYDYLTKPLDFDVLRHTLQRALDHTRLRHENTALKSRLPDAPGMPAMIGDSKPMRDLADLVATVAPTEATVLITGESGTGKELVARAVHAGSPRADGPLVTVNCAALAESLLESELFGHEKGAFTGASSRREGRFLQANKGTLFLDEIGEIPASMQVKLLRALQEGEVQRVGGDETLSADVRVIAATNRDLGAEVEAGRFREDLYYRLNVIAVHVPPLRERDGDIPLLARWFLDDYAQRNRKHIKNISPKAMDAMLRYPWPGNVRELENAVERAVILSTGEYVTERELPPTVAGYAPGAEEAGPEARTASFADKSLEEIEAEAVAAALERTRGNKSEAARILGITRATLHNKIKKYGLA